MTGIVRLIGIIFFILTFLEGATLGHAGLGLINCVVFSLLALAVLRFAPERWGHDGQVYGMAGAFFISLATPFVLYLFFGEQAVSAPQPEITGADTQ
ncbi:hypothetical protein [Aurantiacibacter sediminis]|uniref:DUF805 domain-containing protein n=1 Tax=Aurantiacibacter sediminis TaxID=2793064 RepID=A0ABS0N1S0_9SPHN|nr:hypothetical protein [Aurantiacibacter sediminis]MBH5321905.1 hypothetical protein [Aurantiacibacter sediminis]